MQTKSRSAFGALAAFSILLPLARADEGPAQTFHMFSQGLAAGKPEVLWTLLPASYQKDVTGLIQQFAGKMDPELWNQSVTVARKTAGVLKTKKEFILSNPIFQGVPNFEEVNKNWGALVGLIDTLLESDAADLNKLKSPDPERFLRETGGKLFQQVTALAAAMPGNDLDEKIAQAKQAKAEVVKQGENSATLKIASGAETIERDVVKVEGKWIPKPMAEEWGDVMKQARQALDQIKPERIAEAKPVVLEMMKKVEASLDKMAAAKTADEFNSELGVLIETVGSIGAG